MSLADKVRQTREKLGMTQKQLAEASGISQATISRIESGHVRELKSHALRRLANALGVTVDYLVDMTDRLSANDIVRSDPEAERIILGYQRLSGTGRTQLLGFLQFLEEHEDKKDIRRR